VDTLPIPLVVVLAAVLIATVTDLLTFKIHNVLTLPLLVTGLAYQTATHGADGFIAGLLGAGVGFGLFLFVFLGGGMGGGDVKLLAGVGAWLGVVPTLVVATLAALAGGVYALVVVVARGRTRETWVNLQLIFLRLAAVGRHLVADDRVEEVVGRDDRRSRLIPFGAMTGVGVVALIAIAWLRPGQ
jgi:prepilin peptidase CpaA